MNSVTTRQLLDQLHVDADRDTRAAQARRGRRAASCTELRALITAALADLATTSDDVHELIDSRRPGVNVGASAPGKGAASPAPLNVGALSVLQEAAGYHRDVFTRIALQLQLDTGTCPWPPTYRTLTDLLEQVTDPDRLRRIHRDVEQLADQAHRVVDGVRRLPDPCPHCRRHTLLVDHDTGVTTCAKDPKTGRREPCQCTDRYCPCHHDPRYRHTWSRGERAHKPTSWQGLSRAQKEADMLEAAITRVRDLHTPDPVQPWSTDCREATAGVADDQVTHVHEYLEEWGESICLTCPPVSHVCRHCHQLTYGTTDRAYEDDQPALYPCETIRALDDLPTPAAAAADPDPDSGS